MTNNLHKLPVKDIAVLEEKNKKKTDEYKMKLPTRVLFPRRRDGELSDTTIVLKLRGNTIKYYNRVGIIEFKADNFSSFFFFRLFFSNLFFYSEKRKGNIKKIMKYSRGIFFKCRRA